MYKQTDSRSRLIPRDKRLAIYAIPTPEEVEATQSRRYAGNQIQPQKTVAVLKGRRWVADYEDGLQKIYYKENNHRHHLRHGRLVLSCRHRAPT